MKDTITAHSIANEIRMTRSQFSGCFVIVEGKTADLRVYGRFFDSEACQIIPAHGKDRALEALEILENHNFAGVLAIVDADFWRLEGRVPKGQNVFITDGHDLETMILKSPALEKLITEFGSTEKLENLSQNRGKALREILLELGRPLGYLRWLSKQRNLLLTFEDIPFSKFIDRTYKLDTGAMINSIKNKSGRHDLAEVDLQSEIRAIEDVVGHDPWDICCGHDLVCIISLGLRTALGSNQANEVRSELLQKVLRAAYETAFFLETELFQSLLTWQAANPPFTIFPKAQL